MLRELLLYPSKAEPNRACTRKGLLEILRPDTFYVEPDSIDAGAGRYVQRLAVGVSPSHVGRQFRGRNRSQVLAFGRYVQRLAGGVLILSAEGKHLGTIAPAELPANVAWGDADGKTLYITARSSIYRIRLNIEGLRP